MSNEIKQPKEKQFSTNISTHKGRTRKVEQNKDYNIFIIGIHD
jgi:hypothetical protein